ncbi:ATP-binding protein [Erythrobacter litoralis]|uniref:DNA-packaging protein n=1 Tax=Erythrobacter litoralis TaxID=39960 RepID=UPI0024356777|nr:terminase family protein [Erythrobacter litoralis]MDG6079177.1 ATP-binding protein [Erythrobacter litoralis]
MRDLNALLAWLLKLEEEKRLAELARLSRSEREEFRYHWHLWARTNQIAPPGEWRTWLVSAGRGFGKTRAGAEWVREKVRHTPDARIALVGASLAEARSVMVEGESGLLACCPPHNAPLFEPSLRRLVWPNGAMAFLYSAAEPEALRGPQHHYAWCDEIAKWDNASERATRAWDNLALGMRLGETPQTLATTTPRVVALMRRLCAEEAGGDVIVTRGATYENAQNLPPRFLRDMKQQFARTSLGRQELDGVLLEDMDGALWSRALLESCRDEALGDPPLRIVIGVDPPASDRGDECGIVVCGLGASGMGQVLADASIARPRPERWARAVADAAAAWNADRVVAEANQGGQMVESVLRAADIALPVKLVHASRGKAARAEPVAALYEAGRVRHTALFARLEDQLCGMMTGCGYEGPGRSPDRADALIWALSELMLGKANRPRVRQI